MVTTIDYDAIVKNAQYFKSRMNVKLCAVVKSNAYGHGLEKTAAYLQGIADCFAVANVEEALRIKQFQTPILILMPLFPDQTKLAIENGFFITIDSLATLKTVQTVAGSNLPVSAHVKIDSGMHRFGFKQNELTELCEKLTTFKNLRVDGIFTHMWSSAYADCLAQAEYFDRCVAYVESKIGYISTKHVANTSTAQLGSRFAYDMVRIGLGLYGYGDGALKPAKTVCGKIITLNAAEVGEPIGYGGARLRTKSKLAVVDVGYANGFPRSMQGSYVSVNGTLCQVVAKVCMSCAIIDVSAVDVAIGDDVILLGSGVNPSTNDVIVYELLCNLQ